MKIPKLNGVILLLLSTFLIKFSSHAELKGIFFTEVAHPLWSN